MTWSYDDSLPTDRDKVRLRVGDIDTKKQFISNEGIDDVLSRFDAVDRAVYETAKIMLANPLSARATDRQGTGFSASRSQLFQHLKDLIAEFKTTSRLNATPTLTGVSVSEKETLDSDTDYPPSRFVQGDNDNDQSAN